MPLDSFEIESYYVTADPRGYLPYHLSVKSPASTHGGQSLATIFFMSESNLPSAVGRAYNIGGPILFEDRIIYGYADKTHFESMYRILQTEDPVSFRYLYGSGNSTTRELYSFDLNTADEPTGEGMAEKGLQALVSAGELDLGEMDAEELGVEDVDALRPTEEFPDLE